GWVDEEVGALVDKAARVFAELGAHVEEKDPGFPDLRAPFEAFYTASMTATLDAMAPEKRALMDPGYIEMAEAGRRHGAKDLLEAWAAREALGRHMNAFHESYDLLLTPQLPLTAFEVGRTFPAGRGLTAMFDWLPFTFPFNFTQQPAASVPCGFTAEGLPAALQIVAARYREDLVLRASRAYEAAHPFKMPSFEGAQR